MADPPPGSGAPSPSTDARLLDATGRVLDAVDWPRVTMAAVAREAGVSRQTLYKRFGSRSELAQAYILREATRLVDGVESALIADVAAPRRALAAAFDVFLGAAADHPLVRAVVTDEGGDELLGLVTTRGGPVLSAAAARLSAVIQVGWPSVSVDDASLLAEVAVRLAISVAAQPAGSVPLDGAALARALGPFIDQALGEAG